jgi:hypothetical protein
MRFLWALNRSNYHKKSIALNSMIMKFTKEKILAILLFLSGIVYIGGYYHQSDPGIIIQSDPPKLSTRLIA